MDSVAEYAEYILECSQQNPAKLLKSSPSPSKSKSLDQKLLDLYIEESSRQPEDKKLLYASHLLGKLLKRERLNCLVLSLYPGNEGYSLMLRARSGVEAETIKLPYEESEVLEYIDAAELPPFLLDLLEKAQVNVFYSGCVIVEVRDYRRSAPGFYDTQYVLLRPSAQSLLCDAASLAAEFGQGTWTQEDLQQLEAELLIATSEPLCLDPSPAVCMVMTELNRKQKMFNDPSLRRAIKKHTQAAVNRKRKLAQGPAPRELRLLDFLHKKRDKSKTVTSSSKSAKNSVDMWKQRSVQLNVPESLDVEKYFKTADRPSSPGDNLILVEEHRLERDPNQEHRMLACISVYRQRLADGFVGRLYLDHDFSGDETSKQGCSCQFPLGTKQNVDRYLEQFKELFTEEGRRLVKITTQRPGQAPEITLTQVTQVPSSGTTSITITSAQALLKQATSMAATITPQSDATTGSLPAKRNIPIQLSLSITPVVPATTASGIIPPQAGNQATVSMQGQTNQSQPSSQRLKQLSLHQRASSSPMASPVSTPTSTSQQIAAIISQQTGLQKAPTPTPAPTPPPNSRTPTPTQPLTPSITPTPTSSRRTSAPAVDSLQSGQVSQQTTQQPQNVSFIQQEPVGSVSGSQGGTQGAQLSNINIASISSLPPSLNIQGLGISGVSLANLGLQHMQVSLSMPGIAVPVPITMISTNPSLLQNQTGILTSSSATGSSPAALVTMVTALPASSASSTTCTSNTSTVSSQVVMSTGVGSSQTTVLPSSSGMLSLPVGLTQLMPVTKTQGNVGLRGPASLPVLQLPGGQQSIQLLSLQQQQRGGQLKTGTLTAAISTSTTQPVGVTAQRAGSSPGVPLSSVLTGQHVTPLASLTVGKGGAATGTPQFIQLTGGAQGAGTAVPNPQGGSQTLHTQLAFQKAPQGSATGQTLQFHQLHLKQGTVAAPTLPGANLSSSSKSKSKKRSGTTPPKSL